jgi:hypothetical protein
LSRSNEGLLDVIDDGFDEGALPPPLPIFVFVEAMLK